MKKIFFCILIFLPFLSFGQDKYENCSIHLYVSAPDGLRGRAEPNLNSKVIKVLKYGERVDIDRRTKEKYTINGITDYWYYDTHSLWLFGGYLTDRLENEPIVGFWAEEGALRRGWEFYPTGIAGTGLKDAGHWSGGPYKLDKNNNLSIEFSQYRGDELYKFIVTGRIEFINNDKIRLIINNETEYIHSTILVRDNRR
jgi:hypothetical protein